MVELHEPAGRVRVQLATRADGAPANGSDGGGGQGGDDASGSRGALLPLNTFCIQAREGRGERGQLLLWM